MIRRIRLKNFKSFRELDLELEPLSIFIGVNASGKSNFREALRFLNGVGRGYSLIEILGEKWGQGGELLWPGLRGGPDEVVFRGGTRFEIGVEAQQGSVATSYRISVEVERVRLMGADPTLPDAYFSPRIVAEHLIADGKVVFEATASDSHKTVVASFYGGTPVKLPSGSPVLRQLTRAPYEATLPTIVDDLADSLLDFSFLEPDPRSIRRSSFPGSPLGPHGENLSAAMFDLFRETPRAADVVLESLQSLAPVDVAGFSFRADPTGRIELMLKESHGREFSLASASDGTLRFLTMLVALLQGDRIFFLEEVETGLHPSRLNVLLDILNQASEASRNQVFATSHSPQVLGLLGQAALNAGYLAFRSEATGESTIKRFRDIPDAREVLEKQDLARLHASGWFEDVSAFAESEA